MRNFTIYLSLFVCLIVTKLTAQETFEFKAKMIAAKIDAITQEEKAALKLEVESVNQQRQNGTITGAEADQQKLKFAEARAKSIEERVAIAEAELSQLVKDRVDGKIKDADSTRKYSISIDAKKRRDRIREFGESRTTTQFVFAAGLNNLETNNSVAHSDYKIWGSHFYEWGFTYNTRILKTNNILHAKYGLSLMYNNLRPTDNRILIKNGDQTDLETSPINLKDSRFRNVNLVLPLHLEFDFSKKSSRKSGEFTGHIAGFVSASAVLPASTLNQNRY